MFTKKWNLIVFQEHLPVADDLYQEDKQNLSVLTEAVVDNEAQLAGSLFTFSVCLCV